MRAAKGERGVVGKEKWKWKNGKWKNGKWKNGKWKNGTRGRLRKTDRRSLIRNFHVLPL